MLISPTASAILSLVFFRTKFIKGTPLLQLVESFRNQEGQPRQRVIASLGDAQIPKKDQPIIAQAVQSRLAGSLDLIPPKLSDEAASWITRILNLIGRSKSARPASVEKVDGVVVNEVNTEDSRQLGPQLVALSAWNSLGMTKILAEQGLNPSQIATAQLMVANRLIEPLSEWALIDWSQHTALPELLDIRLTKSTKDRLYSTSDALFAHRKSIEASLRKNESGLFQLQRGIVLYDVTNTHFEGICANNPKALHGRNKQKRSDCRQVAVGMAFDENGFALGHEVFEGNISESKTLIRVLDQLVIPGDGLQPVVILDAGFASAQNIEILKNRRMGYLINVTRGSRTKYAKAFAEGGFEPVPGRPEHAGVEVKCIPDPDDPTGKLVLCRSMQRREKEKAMLSKAEQRFLADVEALQNRIAKGRLKSPDKIERSIGRMQKKHPRVSRFYTVKQMDGALQVTRNEEQMEQADELCGTYVLKTDREHVAEQIWSMYMVLLQAEEGFSMLKGTLGLRPNFHQLGHRVEGHIFITILAYHLLTWVRRMLHTCGDRRDWKGICRLLSTHMLTTVVLPLADGRVLRIRKPGQPDAGQQSLYDKLKIDWRSAFRPVKTFTKW